MTEQTTTATRRGVLAALAGTAAFAGTIGAAIAATTAEAATITGEPTPEGNRLYDEAFGHGFKEGGEIALLHMARAWVDRWKAAGGFFNLSHHEHDGEGPGTRMGIGWSEYGRDDPDWTARDGADSPLAPHIRITESEHCRGARKALEAMLELVPGLKDTVREIMVVPLLTAGGWVG